MYGKKFQYFGTKYQDFGTKYQSHGTVSQEFGTSYNIIAIISKGHWWQSGSDKVMMSNCECV